MACISALIFALLALAAVLGPPFIGHPSYLPDVHLAWWAMAIAFSATDMFVLNVQARRETHTLTLSEIPLVLGLFFAAPLDLLVGRGDGSASAVICYLLSAPLKTAFNLSLVLTETSFRSPCSGHSRQTPVTGPASWLGRLRRPTRGHVGALAICIVIAVARGRGCTFARPRRAPDPEGPRPRA